MTAKPDERLVVVCEIAALAMDRMNNGTDISAAEAFTLGQISGTAMRIPGVIQYLKDREKQAEFKASQGMGRSWPPGVHGPAREDQ